MASLRKRYRPNLESPIAGNEPPVMSPPEVTAAELPPAVEPKPMEQIETQSSADAAGAAAIKARLAEMERAEKFVQGAAQHQQRPASEPPQQQPQMPAQVAKWLAEHPQYLNPNDQVAQAEINLATMKCIRDGKTWHDDDFIPTVEKYLGLTSQGNGQATSPAPAPPPTAAAAPAYRAPQPQPQQRRSSVPVSAPPTRESPSLATGRPISDV